MKVLLLKASDVRLLWKATLSKYKRLWRVLRSGIKKIYNAYVRNSMSYTKS